MISAHLNKNHHFSRNDRYTLYPTVIQSTIRPVGGGQPAFHFGVRRRPSVAISSCTGPEFDGRCCNRAPGWRGARGDEKDSIPPPCCPRASPRRRSTAPRAAVLDKREKYDTSRRQWRGSPRAFGDRLVGDSTKAVACPLSRIRLQESVRVFFRLHMGPRALDVAGVPRLRGQAGVARAHWAAEASRREEAGERERTPEEVPAKGEEDGGKTKTTTTTTRTAQEENEEE
jgi:hypothetical protein